MKNSEVHTTDRNMVGNNQVKSLIRVGTTTFRVTSLFNSDIALKDVLLEIIKESRNSGILDIKTHDKAQILSYNSYGK